MSDIKTNILDFKKGKVSADAFKQWKQFNFTDYRCHAEKEKMSIDGTGTILCVNYGEAGSYSQYFDLYQIDDKENVQAVHIEMTMRDMGHGDYKDYIDKIEKKNLSPEQKAYALYEMEVGLNLRPEINKLKFWEQRVRDIIGPESLMHVVNMQDPSDETLELPAVFPKEIFDDASDIHSEQKAHFEIMKYWFDQSLMEYRQHYFPMIIPGEEIGTMKSESVYYNREENIIAIKHEHAGNEKAAVEQLKQKEYYQIYSLNTQTQELKRATFVVEEASKIGNYTQYVTDFSKNYVDDEAEKLRIKKEFIWAKFILPKKEALDQEIEEYNNTETNHSYRLA